jgi:Acetyltransferases
MNCKTMVVRPYDAASDMKKLSTIWFEASMIAHSFVGKARLLEQQRLVEEKYLPSAETFVACVDGEPVGFISMFGSFIGALFVSPHWQGRGIGRALIGVTFRQKGELSLEVYTRNEQACAFYRAVGFQEVSRRPVDDQGLPFESVLLRRR